jgi:hypothetical protein
MRVMVFHGLFGGWGWEQVDGKGRAIAESTHAFESVEECLEDARLRTGQKAIYVNGILAAEDPAIKVVPSERVPA